MVSLTIDGKEISVERGTKIIEAAQRLGIFIPHYCYHPALSTAGSCRLCLVEVEGIPREVVACGTPVTDGMVVHTNSGKVQHDRRIILEFLLLNHPLDCPICDKAGECHLQDYSFAYGSSHSRFTEPKRVPPFKDLGPHVRLATTRCILCTRCTRFMTEIAGDAQLGVINRGSRNEIAVADGKRLDHPLAGNVVDICPVGALQDKSFIHRTRVWHLSNTPSICGECSAGCNISIDTFKNSLYRVKPRHNKDVNGFWICDSGRYGYTRYDGIERLTIPKLRDGSTFSDTSWDEALQTAADGLSRFKKSKDTVAGLIDPTAVNEDAYAVKELLKKAFKSSKVTGLFRKPSRGDQVFKGGFVIKGDQFPNQEGIRFLLGLEALDYNGEAVLTGIETGKIKAVYCVHNSLVVVPERILGVLKKLEFLVVEDITLSPLAQAADVVLPGTTFYEKSGTAVNYKKHLQVVRQGKLPPEGTRNTWDSVRRIAANLKHQLPWFSAGDVFMSMAREYPGLSGLTHFRIGEEGKPLSEYTKVKEAVD